MCSASCLNLFDLIGNRKKMIFCLLLNGVLWFALLCFFSKCYCLQLSDTDVANSIYNIAKAQGVTLTKNDIDLTVCGTIATTYNNNQGKYLISTIYNSNNQIEFYLYNGKPYLANNIVYAQNSVSSIRYAINTKSFVRSSFASANPSRLGTYYYTDANVYSAYNSNTISIGAGTYVPSNFDMFADNLYVNDYFTFIYNTNLNSVNIDDFNEVKQIYSNNYGSTIAEFGKTYHLSNVTLTYWKYEKSRGYFEPLIVKNVNTYNIINDDVGNLYFNYDQFIPNTIMQYTLVSNNLENFSSLSPLFYCCDINTVIDNNGDLNISSTFDDDYYQRYNNVINNLLNTSGGVITSPSGDVTGYIDLQPINDSIQNINNTLTDSSQVDSILDNYNSSGEILGALGYETIGESNYNLYLAPILYVVNKINDTLMANDDPYFDIPLRDGTFKRIYASDFTTPETLIKQFVRLFMVFVTLYVVYLRFKEVIEIINSGNAINVLHTEDADMYFFKM